MEVIKDNRRRQRRLAVSMKIKVYRLDKDTKHLLNVYLFETKDMTQKGFFLKTPETFPIGTKLKIELKLKPEMPVITADSEVTWIAKPSQTGYYPGMGIKMARIEHGGAKKIREYLKEKFLNYRHALELKKMYLQLKEMAARLYDMEQCHTHAPHFLNVIGNAIEEIDNIAHTLDREVWEVKSL